MHDPSTVALEIKSPFRQGASQFFPKGYRPALITVWHEDPEKDGSDDSCDWFGRKRPLSREEKAIFEAMQSLENILDNRPFFPDHEAHRRFQPLKDAIWQLKRRKGWRIHPRWHVWHWRIQFHPVQELKRWLFSRCCVCGNGFSWGYSPCSNSWHGSGPRWFRGEKNVFHHGCDTSSKPAQSFDDTKEKS